MIKLLPKYASTIERDICHRLVDILLGDGNSITIFNGEEITLQKSTDKHKILTNMASAGDDGLRVSNVEGKWLGSFWLIYGNESDLISDYTANDYCESIVSLFDTLHLEA